MYVNVLHFFSLDFRQLACQYREALGAKASSTRSSSHTMIWCVGGQKHWETPRTYTLRWTVQGTRRPGKRITRCQKLGRPKSPDPEFRSFFRV